MPRFGERLMHAWNAFNGRDRPEKYVDYGPGYSTRPDRLRLTRGNERSIVTAVYNRIGIDCASVAIRHVRVDENERYLETIHSGLNECLSVEANKDQTGRAFVQDAIMSMCDEGVIAIVPVDTDIRPINNGGFDIRSMRTAKIVQWYPDEVRVSIWNDRKGIKEELTLPKKMVAIVENPLYAVMNEPNSTMQRLIRKLNMLDIVDEQNSSGKMNMIIQLPYTVRTDLQKARAEERRKNIEMQLTSSKYGIAYADATEKITQLGGGVQNGMLEQVDYLTKMLYNQLGMTEAVFDGTADEQTMRNYYNRTIEPMLAALTGAMKRSFLTKTARTQGQSIIYFNEPFKLVPILDLANVSDVLIRNQICTPNEIRGLLGMKPSNDAVADELSNPNVNPINQEQAPEEAPEEMPEQPTEEAPAEEGIWGE